jgi:type I site-specific restriction endonuclease
MTKPISADPEQGGGYRKPNRTAGKASGGSGSSFGLNIVLFILIAGLMGAGWFITLQAEQMTEMARVAEDRAIRLARLEDRSTEAATVLSETGKSTGQKLDYWEDEIRKLWDVTNKRNKKWIETNQKALQKNSNALAGISASLKSIKGDVSRHDSSLGKQTEIQDALTSVDLRVRQLVGQQREMIDQANATRQIVAKLEDGLARRVELNERAIEAIDGSRLDTNGRLAALSARIDALSTPASP